MDALFLHNTNSKQRAPQIRFVLYNDLSDSLDRYYAPCFLVTLYAPERIKWTNKLQMKSS